MRELLVVFPNLFENFLVCVLLTRRFFPSFIPRTLGNFIVLLALLWAPKIAQEWPLHWEQDHPWQLLGDLMGRVGGG
jgi:hypothetical protein